MAVRRRGARTEARARAGADPTGARADLEPGTRRVAGRAFEGARLRSADLPESVEEVGPRAFAGCSSLRWAIVRGPRTAVAPDAFEGCDSLRRALVRNEGQRAALLACCPGAEVQVVAAPDGQEEVAPHG